MIPSASSSPIRRTVSPALLFALACMWLVVALAGGRLTGTLTPAPWSDLSVQAGTAALLFAGFYLLARVGVADLRPLSSIGFVKRPGILTEFGTGAAIGWGIALAVMLPVVFSRDVQFTFHADGNALVQLMVSLLVLTACALVQQLVLSGLPVRLLVRAIGSTWAVAAVLLVGVGLVATSNTGNGKGILVTVLSLSLSLCAFLRTRAIWLSLGLQIGWTVSLQLLFGVPSLYAPAVTGMVRGHTDGPRWLTGGAYGPEASTIATVVLLAALVTLFRVTRDYAWHYTYHPVVAGGVPVEVAASAAHVKETERAATAAPLVQIAGITPARDASTPTEPS